MSDITLSKAVRSNLLNLQSTATQLGKTQERLATGQRVNSALDNPTNFFTASSLNSRASDMSQLLDSMSNGIQTIEAADNGLTAITKTLESMQSTLTQARQDKSFKATSFTIDAAASGNISFSGGAVGSTGVDISLASTASGSTLTGTGGVFTAVPSASITVNGTSVAVSGDVSASAATLQGSVTGIAADPDWSGLTGESISVTDGAATFTYNFDGNANGQLSALQSAATAQGFTVTRETDGHLSITGVNTGADFTVTTSDAAVDTALGFTNNAASSNGVTANDATATSIATQINAVTGTTGVTADGSSGQIVLTDATGATITLGGDDTLLTTIGFGTSNRTASGTPSEVNTVDSLVSSINNDTGLSGKVRASNDNGKLRIENLSTQDLTVTGYNSTSAKVDGGTGTSTIGGNTVRADLAEQYNTLRDQLDKISDDASFNGVNLLRGDNLKITFNETSTSEISIQAKDGKAVNSASLGIQSSLTADNLDSDTNIDSYIGLVKDALGSVRSQASSFGSNLSVVQNRQDFTKNMINTLQTGASNLTLADSNEEAANLLALQTRQQLSSTALSLASQSDQNVLRLF